MAARRILSRLRRDERGVSALEFALILPVLVMFSVGVLEFGRLMLLTQKVQNSAFILADLAARDKEICQEQLESMFLALDDLLAPFDMAASGRAIVSSLKGNADEDAVIQWQEGGAGSLSATSAYGAVGQIADLPAPLSIAEDETVIIAEVFFAFDPLFGLNLEGQTLHKVAYFKPRLGALDTLPACEA